MKKIPTLFERDWEGDKSRVLDRIHPGCEWVQSGEGVATRKLDGTCCLVRDGTLLKRRELRDGDTIPPDFEEADRDPETKKIIGWVPVGDGPEDKWHREAHERGVRTLGYMGEGTYELLGPKIQGNPENYSIHVLMPHSLAEIFFDAPRTFDDLRGWLTDRDIEGLVFHHPDGRMAKIKQKDFGLKRTKTANASPEAHATTPEAKQ